MVAPGAGSPSMRAMAPEKIHGWRRKSDLSRPGLRMAAGINQGRPEGRLEGLMENTDLVTCIDDDAQGMLNFLGFVGGCDRCPQAGKAFRNGRRNHR